MERILLIGSQGYVGSALEPQLYAKYGVGVDACDIGWFVDSRSLSHFPLYRKDYKEIKGFSIEKYDAVILLAGHSSVPMCKDDLRSALNNNVRNFWDLLGKLRDDQPLIYASSGSVYGSGSGQFREGDALAPAFNWYDLSKQEIDRIALLSGKKTYGLRFGTVCGASPNPRTELMLNSMFLSAKNTHTVRVNNLKKVRAILGMKDLVAGVMAILKRVEEAGAKNSGIYNLASFNAEIGYMADKVCSFMDAIKQVVPDNPTYDFALNTQKFQEVFDWAPKDTIESILLDLKKNYGKINEAQRETLSRNRMIKYD
jgi:nucleoside-diphosphate-sugar epimerase